MGATEGTVTVAAAMAVATAADIDIYRSANVLIRKHGEDAAIEAAMRTDAMLDKGNLDGYAVWNRIVRAVEEIQRSERNSKDPLH